MKKLAVAALACSVCVWAADFWQSKPFTDWSDKDLHKMVENSPWSKQVSVAVGGLDGPESGSGRGGRRGTSSMGEAGNPAQGGGIGEDPMGSAGGRGGRGGGDAPGPIASTTLVVRWQTALPVKQALVKMKYGSEVTTSPEAKKILDSEEKAYVIAVSGVGPAMMGQGMRGGGDPEAMKKALMEQSSLAVKGKDEVKPTAVQFGRVGRGFEVYLVFPKKDEFSMDDKEIEFVTRLGPVQVKQKFRLKDMVYNGKLAL